MRDLVDKMQAQIRTYKKQIEEAEEIAAINLSKFRYFLQNIRQFSNTRKLKKRSSRGSNYIFRSRGKD
jgi:hypothetical protein